MAGGLKMGIQYVVRLFSVLGVLFIGVNQPTNAAENDSILKQEIEKLTLAYANSFNRQDASGIAAVFSHDGIYLSSAGARADIGNIYQNVWKAGFDHIESTVESVWPLAEDIAVSAGGYRTTGKNKDGAPIEIRGRWSAVDVRMDGQWKIRMLSVMRQQP
jgi:uncharacterized protein (TIGR02246 family)